MHTVIIHTLGAAYVKKDIYFLAYDPEQILWLEAKQDQIRNCAGLIRDYRSQRAVQEDYRLVILADLDPFANSEFQDHRERLMKLLRYWYIKELLRPLDEDFLLPESVTIVFLSTKNKDNATSPAKNYTHILDIRSEGDVRKVTLSFAGRAGQEGGTLDYTPYLGTLVTETDVLAQAAQASAAQTTVASPLPPLGRRPERLEPIVFETAAAEDEPFDAKPNTRTADYIESEIDNAQSYSPIRQFGEHLKILSIPYESTLTSPRGIFADLQINLSRLIRLYEEAPQKVTASSIRPNNRDAMTEIMANASAVLRKTRSAEGLTPIYYPLTDESTAIDSGSDGLYSEMTQELAREVEHLPGLKDALAAVAQPVGTATPDAEDIPEGDNIADMTRRKLYMGWLRLGSIKREFHQVYGLIEEQYDPETVFQEQQKILGVCASHYARWRTKQRQVIREDQLTPTQTHRPQMPTDSFKKLKAARESCAKGVLEQLQDYSDVREEAAQIHTQFRKATRFWAPEEPESNNKRFRRFSLIMGILFVCLALIPFFFITSESNDFEGSRTLVFVLTALVFAFLYSIGVIVWLNSVANTLWNLVFDLKQLLYESQKLREESIGNVLEVYSSQLPACLLEQATYDRMANRDRENEESTRKYEEHMYIMSNALDEIDEVRTSLRLPYKELADIRIKPPDYLKPPYDPVNKKFYMLFERGNK